MNPQELARFLGGIPPAGRVLEPLRDLPRREDLSPGALWAEFSSAVSRQIEGFSRIGVPLGGLDSSGILAAAVEQRGPDGVIALSYRGVDDDPFVDELCRHLRVHCVPLDWDQPMSQMHQGLIVGGQPFASSSGSFDLHLASVAKSHGVDVMLSGYAGDDILEGDLELFAPMLRRRPFEALPAMLSARLPRSCSSGTRIWRWGLAPMLRRAVPPRVRVERARLHVRRRMPWLSREVLDTLDSGLKELVEATRPPTTPLEVYENRATLPDYRMWTQARTQLVRESGVEQREPYLDSRLVAVLSAVPISALFLGGASRGLFREALRNRVPNRVRERIGKAYSREIQSQYRAKIQATLRPLSTLSALSGVGLVRPRVFEDAFEQRGPYDWVIWRTLAAEAYLQRGGSSVA